MQKNSLLNPVLIIIIIVIIVGIFVVLTKTKSNVREEIGQNTSTDLESNINIFMEAMVTEDDLGKDSYHCANSIFGQDDKYVYAHTLCMGYEFNTKGELEPVSGSSLPVRFEYTMPGFKIIGYTAAPDGENNDSVWKEIFPGEYYDKAISGGVSGVGKILEQKLKYKIDTQSTESISIKTGKNIERIIISNMNAEEFKLSCESNGGEYNPESVFFGVGPVTMPAFCGFYKALDAGRLCYSEDKKDNKLSNDCSSCGYQASCGVAAGDFGPNQCHCGAYGKVETLQK